MKTLSQYCKDNILVIPQALASLEGATVLMGQGDLAIYYKHLQDDLSDVEFYTNTPCFIYIESGVEVITTSDNGTHELGSNTVIFLPQGENLHSDFFHAKESLRGYLVFMDDAIISEYLRTRTAVQKGKPHKSNLFKVKGGAGVHSFFKSIQAINSEGGSSQALLRLKLLEFLHILALLDESSLNLSLAYKPKTVSPKRNIARLLEGDDILHLSVNDLSNLSGRSLSSFNRDFKAIYNMPPKRWLQERRLIHTRKLLMESDLSVTEVAVQVGYDNVSHFIKLFKNKYKVTPKQLKQSD